MGTRSLTNILDEQGETLLTVYRQFDGYLSGMGEDLASFLKDFTIVNGYNGNENQPAANGMGCLAAQLIKHLKEGIGNVYIYPANTKDCGEEYVYTISFKEDAAFSQDRLRMKCQSVHGGYSGKKRTLHTLFDGSVREFDSKKIKEDEEGE